MFNYCQQEHKWGKEIIPGNNCNLNKEKYHSCNSELRDQSNDVQALFARGIEAGITGSTVTVEHVNACAGEIPCGQ